eukprot:TRINITY_DN10502_c0_g2_i6.p1 TRINITY_DN10502_c0_g2~~TRINITY_DN10502_c0_g2_i6.p1  ORF type:complete len:255 (+),score=30.33 TRINITY_DN10502_c0_g2_i6:75-839(+)
MARVTTSLLSLCFLVSLGVGLAARVLTSTFRGVSTVSIKDLSCKNLINKHTFRTLNPYVVVRVGNVEASTPVTNNDLNPDFGDWNHTFEVGPNDNVMHLDIMDRHTLDHLFYVRFSTEFRELETDKWTEHDTTVEGVGTIRFWLLWHAAPQGASKKNADKRLTGPRAEERAVLSPVQGDGAVDSPGAGEPAVHSPVHEERDVHSPAHKDRDVHSPGHKVVAVVTSPEKDQACGSQHSRAFLLVLMLLVGLFHEA